MWIRRQDVELGDSEFARVSIDPNSIVVNSGGFSNAGDSQPVSTAST